MKKLLTILVLVLCLPSMLWADDISLQEALQIAKNFAVTNAGALSKQYGQTAQVEPQLAHAMKSKSTQKDNVYVINLGSNQGFVIVSGEDGADQQVLGYCDHGSFDFAKAPIQMKDLLESYSLGVDSLRENPAPKEARAKAETSDNLTSNFSIGDIIVGPLLTTTWNQRGPYNYMCPEGCPTGCVPTAIGQVMYYWKWPDVTRGTVRGTEEDFSGHTYDWDNMLPYYTYGYTSEQAVAVAKLMADIGKAFGTVYEPDGSPTEWSYNALIDNFNFSPDISFERAATSSALVMKMQDELDQRQPVLYCGSASYGGSHALVVDGYTSMNYFHFNYGWGGDCDGWYMNALCSMYSKDVWIFTGVRPYDAIEVELDHALYGLLKDGTAELIKYNFEGEEKMTLNIPNTIKDSDGNEYKVTRILRNAFSGFCNFSKITIGDNVTNIEPMAFVNAEIDELVIGDQIEVIPYKAFWGSSIRDLTIGANVKEIGNQAFNVCGIVNITSKSPAFKIGYRAFAHSNAEGEWLNCITEIGDEGLAGCSFSGTPKFTKLEKLGARCFTGASGMNGRFNVSAILSQIDPEAFYNSQISTFEVDENNPYYSSKGSYLLCNKNSTSLVVLNSPKANTDAGWFPETIIKFGPGSITSRQKAAGGGYYDLTIPSQVEDVTDAFIHSKTLGRLTCLAAVPPTATDSTFNEALFQDKERVLNVPAGSEELYQNAPGWRRFPRIIGSEEYVPAPVNPNREYYMILHCSNDEGSNVKRRIPVSKVKNIQVGDYISGSGQSLVVAAEGETNTYRVDSITWMKGFVYGESEVFDLGPENLVAEGRDCTVRLGKSVVSDDVQLSIRRVISASNITEGVNKSVAVDINLSTGQHELDGVAEIRIPITVDDKEKLMAAYYNEETGKWDPVLCLYDKQTNTARILTDHLSLFEVFTVENVNSRLQRLKLDQMTFGLYSAWLDYSETVDLLLDMMVSDEPDAVMFRNIKDNVGFWQGLGIDGVWTTLSGFGFTSKAMDAISGVAGHIGKLSSILDLSAAWVKDDVAGYKVANLKAALSCMNEMAAAYLGTSALTICSGFAAIVGIALEEFGKAVQQSKKDYISGAYRYFYSKEGAAAFKTDFYYDNNRWMNKFWPALDKGMTHDRFTAFVEQTVRRHCDKFWEQNNDVYSIIMGEYTEMKKPWGFSTFFNVSESEQKAVSDKYYADLMDGIIKEVMAELQDKLSIKAKKELDKEMQGYVQMMNSYVGFRFLDSSCQGDEPSQFEGCTVQFTTPPTKVEDMEKWQCKISSEGKATLGYFTLYALIDNKVTPQLTLCDPYGDEIATFDYEIDDLKQKTIFQIDLAKQGTPAVVSRNFDLVYEQDTLKLSGKYHYFYTQSTGKRGERTRDNFNPVFIQYSRNAVGLQRFSEYSRKLKNIRFETEVKNFFKEHDSIRFENGKVYLGKDIEGSWNGATKEGSGKFVIKTKYPFVENTLDEYVASCTWNYDITDKKATYPYHWFLLNGTMVHQIECEFKIEPDEDGGGYTITYSGEGSFDLDAEVVTKLINLDFDSIFIPDADGQGGIYDTDYLVLQKENFETGRITDSGKVTLSYKKKIKNVE